MIKVLTLKFIIKSKHDGVVAVIYDALPRQCKQCGFRYSGDDEGKAKMDAHLDWHFRQNRRMKEKSKKAQSRSWFVSDEVSFLIHIII